MNKDKEDKVMNIKDLLLYRRLVDLISIVRGMRDDEISYDYITFGDFTNGRASK